LEKKQTDEKSVSKSLTVEKPELIASIKQDGSLYLEKKYNYESSYGSNTEITMMANIKMLNKDDLLDILHTFAMYSRNFYISLGNEINNKP
ncbi:hypothetical protein, partial [Lachnotalea glycerini]